MNELVIPPAALADKEAFEILRVWAANNEQHVTIHSQLNGGASEFGYLLAQLAYHGSKLYAQRFNQPEVKVLDQILERFNEEINDNNGDVTGSIGD